MTRGAGAPVRSVTVFCGSRFGARPEYEQAARALGTAIARSGLALVYGGASVGLMGALADAALAAGGHVIGVLPQSLKDREVAHLSLSELHVVETLHERKALMERRGDAFVALPGGSGTLDELFEIFTWAQLGIHRKPIALLDTKGFYAPLVATLRHLASEGFVPPEHVAWLLVEEDPTTLVRRLFSHEPMPELRKWATRRDT